MLRDVNLPVNFYKSNILSAVLYVALDSLKTFLRWQAVSGIKTRLQ